MIKFLDEDQNENEVKCSEEEEHDTFHNHCTSSSETALISEVILKSYCSIRSKEKLNFSS